MKTLRRVFFLFALLGILLLKESFFLVLFLVPIWLFSYKDFLKLNKRVLKSILWFNLTVSLGYIIMSFIQDISPWHYVVYINLKVYLVTYFVFLFFSRVDMVEFFSFSKELSYLLSISLSQIISYEKTFEDFRLAYKARVVRKLRERERGFIAQTFEFFLTKALRDSKERTLAMKARGFFDYTK